MKILILVKTYPVASKKYKELVCTAGILEDGSWVRLYPIDFRELPKESKYSKYQYIEVDCVKDLSDPRKESYKLLSAIKPLEHISSSDKWYARKNLVLQNVYYEKSTLLEDFQNYGLSLSIFKPSIVKSFEIKIGEKSSDFKFWYRFTDLNGISSRLRIIDWEIYQLTRKLLAKYGSDEYKIKEILKKKYFDEMKKKDIYLFLGTSRKWHIRKAKNPFMITGIFYPPYA